MSQLITKMITFPTPRVYTVMTCFQTQKTVRGGSSALCVVGGPMKVAAVQMNLTITLYVSFVINIICIITICNIVK